MVAHVGSEDRDDTVRTTLIGFLYIRSWGLAESGIRGCKRGKKREGSAGMNHSLALELLDEIKSYILKVG